MLQTIGTLRWWAGAAALLAGLASARAEADAISYFYTAGEYVGSTFTPITTYTAATGQSVTVPIYLEEVCDPSTTPSLLASESGLGAAAFYVNPFGTLPSSPATITGAAVNAGTPPNGFDSAMSNQASWTSSTASVAESTLPKEGVTAAASQNGVSAVYLGTVTFQAGATNGQMSAFQIGANSTLGPTATNLSDYDLDNNLDPSNPAGSSGLYNSATATILDIQTADVPEPGALALSAAGTVLLGFYAYARRRTPAPC
jgi:hypothetical protein